MASQKEKEKRCIELFQAAEKAVAAAAGSKGKTRSAQPAGSGFGYVSVSVSGSRTVFLNVRLYGKLLSRVPMTVSADFDIKNVSSNPKKQPSKSPLRQRCSSTTFKKRSLTFKKNSHKPRLPGTFDWNIDDDVKVKTSNFVRRSLVDSLTKAVDEVARKGCPGGEQTHMRMSAGNPIDVATAVESVLVEKLGPFSQANKAKYWAILYNMKDPKNWDLRRRVLLGEVTPERLASMTSNEMASDDRQLENHLIRERRLSKQIKKGADDQDQPMSTD